MKYSMVFLMFFVVSCDFLNVGPKKLKRSVKYNNNTKYNIKVFSYKNGKNNFELPGNSSVTPFSYDKFEVHKPSEDYYHLGFVSLYSDNIYVDSIVVVFDNTVKVTHNSRLNLNKNKAIDFYNLRNLTNGDNYKITKLCDSRKDLEANYLYNFYEQDYLDAKAKQ